MLLIISVSMIGSSFPLPFSFQYLQGLLRCMMHQGEFTSAQMHVDGLQVKR